MSNQDLKIFIAESRKIGTNLELVQGAGGNTSVKIDNEIMAIKSSGSLLKQISPKSGFVLLNQSMLKPLLNKAAKLPNPIISENYLHAKLATAVLSSPVAKPSMEAVMHTFLPKHVVHTHSIYANIFNCMLEGPEILKTLFGNEIFIVPYATPGFELALKIRKLAKKRRNNYLIFLLNHGVITTDQNAQKAYKRMVEVNETCKQYLKKTLPSWPQFQYAGPMISAYLKKHANPAQIVEKCCFPDAVVFCSKPEKLSNQTKLIFEVMIYIQATIAVLGGTLRPLNSNQQATLLRLNSEKYRLNKNL